MDKNIFILTSSLYQIQDTFSYLNENGNEELDKNGLFSALDLCNVYGVY